MEQCVLSVAIWMKDTILFSAETKSAENKLITFTQLRNSIMEKFENIE